ncbi:hypothetical protein ZIOFF_037983 [Zingiber officinale]|uniref:Uncharacterized protein n=1 Tax=Zingiber officinale TaxID=94328 RepID=A0A8J5GRX2_ZINOF|nr:hypothetical protein ZIOFF_037983 [Zingiber officinale]
MRRSTGEDIAKEAVRREAAMALSMAEPRLQLALGSIDSDLNQRISTGLSGNSNNEQALLSAEEEIRSCKEILESCNESLKHIQIRKEELLKEVERLREIVEKAQLASLKAEEDVVNIMLLAEKAVTFEVEGTQRVNDAELALQRAEKVISITDASDQQSQSFQDQLVNEEPHSVENKINYVEKVEESQCPRVLFKSCMEKSKSRRVFYPSINSVLVTTAVVGLVVYFFTGQPGPAAIVISNGAARKRGEHIAPWACYFLCVARPDIPLLSKLNFCIRLEEHDYLGHNTTENLAVVVLLILMPLISPNSSKGGLGFQAIAEALGLAAVRAIVAITVIIAGGRLAGLSMALGAFLSGLPHTKSEFSLQVESDITPYRGLLLGLFFMTVSISVPIFLTKF